MRSTARRLGGWIAAALLLASAGWAGPELTGTPAEAPALRDQIESFVRSRVNGPIDGVEIPNLEAFRVDVPADSLSVRLSAHPSVGPGRVPVSVALYAGGELLREGVVTARVRASRPVVVARRALRTGERVGPQHLSVESRPAEDLREGVLADPSRALGRRVRRPIRAGAPLHASLLEEAPSVARGQPVKLRLSRGGLVIEGIGKAREPGRTGDWIRVLNVSSRREVIGRVGSDGVVHVDF